MASSLSWLATPVPVWVLLGCGVLLVSVIAVSVPAIRGLNGLIAVVSDAQAVQAAKSLVVGLFLRHVVSALFAIAMLVAALRGWQVPRGVVGLAALVAVSALSRMRAARAMDRSLAGMSLAAAIEQDIAWLRRR